MSLVNPHRYPRYRWSPNLTVRALRHGASNRWRRARKFGTYGVRWEARQWDRLLDLHAAPFWP